MFTGLRASELRGLRWIDVDLQAGKIHVQQRAERWNTIGKLKSDTSERMIPIGPFVANTLREWRLVNNHALVFGDPGRDLNRPQDTRDDDVSSTASN